MRLNSSLKEPHVGSLLHVKPVRQRKEREAEMAPRTLATKFGEMSLSCFGCLLRPGAAGQAADLIIRD